MMWAPPTRIGHEYSRSITSKISEYFGIEGDVEFLDVDTRDDSRMYVDPAAIRLSVPAVREADVAVYSLDTYFGCVASGVMSRDPMVRARTRRLLCRFSEPWETRLGLSVAGCSGHGGADDVGTWIWRVLNGNAAALLEVGVLARLEHLPMFIEGIGGDITSDITTRVIYEALALFTQRMLDKYPSLTVSVRSHVARHWDPEAQDWIDREVRLPVADGRPLLLVPREWATSSLLTSGSRFYSTTVLGFVQAERTVILPSGKVDKPTKRELRASGTVPMGRATNIEVTMRAMSNTVDLVRQFESFVETKYRSAA